jgi:PAS domain S-box-containing protein
MKLSEAYNRIQREDSSSLTPVKIRFAVIVFFMLITLTTTPVLGLLSSMAPIMATLALALASNILSFYWIASGKLLRLRTYVAGVIDILLVTVLIHYLGGIEAPLIWFYVVVLIATAPLHGVNFGIFMATIGSLAYMALLFSESSGAIPHVTFDLLPGKYLNSDALHLHVKLVSDIILFFIAAIIPGLLSERLRHSRNELQKRNVEIVRMQRELHSHMENLENAVAVRTKELTEANDKLRQEVAERKQAEEQLRHSEQKYRTLLDNIDVGFYEIDLSGNFIFFNGPIQKILGYSEDDLLGMNFRQYVDEENAAKLFTAFHSVYDTGKANKGFVCDVTSKDGTERPIEFSVSLAYDTNGKPIAFRGVARDVSERQEAEERLRTSEEKYRTLFEESHDIILTITPEGKFLDINPAGVTFLGYSSKEEFLSIPTGRDRHISSDVREELQREITEQGFVKDYELELKTKNGQRRTVLLTATAVRTADGTVVAHRGIMRNITEQKQLEQQLLHAQKMESIGTLAGGIAHDFNNILGGIIGYAALTKSKMTRDHPFFAYIDAIERGGLRAAELTSQLLAFARGGKYKVQPVDLNAVVDETLKIIGRTFNKSIDIQVRPARDLPTIEADAAQMQQVLMNLCVNASDAMPTGGKMIVETSVSTITEELAAAHAGARPGPCVNLIVTDNGIGIDGETVQRVFEPFFTTKEEGKGTGLGLSMVYGVVTNHGGIIQVASEPGKGTTFRVFLPIGGKAGADRPATSVPSMARAV